MEYMKKMDISIDRSYRPESDIKLLRFELSGGYLIYISLIYIYINIYHLYISKIYQSKRCTIKPIYRFNRSPKKLIWYPKKITIDMSKAGLITNPKLNRMPRRRDLYVNILSIYICSNDPLS